MRATCLLNKTQFEPPNNRKLHVTTGQSKPEARGVANRAALDARRSHVTIMDCLGNHLIHQVVFRQQHSRADPRRFDCLSLACANWSSG